MKIVYRVSEADYMEARRLFTANEKPQYRRYSRLVMPWIGAADLVIVALYLVVLPHPDNGFVVVGSTVGLFLLYCGFALKRYFRKLYRKDHRFKHDFTAEISHSGICLVTPFSEGQMTWNAFVRFLESEMIFMVFIAEWNFPIFPKRAFSSDEAEQFRSLLQGNIHSPA